MSMPVLRAQAAEAAAGGVDFKQRAAQYQALLERSKEEARAAAAKTEAVQGNVHVLIREKEELRGRAEALATKLVSVYFLLLFSCLFVVLCHDHATPLL